jgi:MFS family permease
VNETAVGPREFGSADGPIRNYRRLVQVEAAGPGTTRVTQTVEYQRTIPLLGWFIALPMRAELGRIAPIDKPPWWGPPDMLDTNAWAAISALLTLATALGYLGTLLTQTVTYSAKEFHANTGAEGVALAVVRADIVISLGLVALADRHGRRLIALGGAAMGCGLTALGALTPSLAWLVASQILARGFVTASTIASGVLVAEIMPKGARAWAIGVIAMVSALGAGVCVVALPVAGVGIGGWRLLYAGALAWLVVVAAAARHLRESDRYLRRREHDRRSDHPAAAGVRTRSRLLLLATANFCLMMFVTPASEFENEYLRRERHFSPARISLFTIVTVLPGAIGIVVGGRLADTRGRRRVGIVAVAGAMIFGIGLFWLAGWPMWLSGTIATLTGAAVTPAIAVYGPELFQTRRRGAANGVLTAAGRLGAVVGLLVVGGLSEWLGRFGPAFAVLSVGPVALIILIAWAFPETAHRALEDMNPADLDLADPPAPPAPLNPPHLGADPDPHPHPDLHPHPDPDPHPHPDPPDPAPAGIDEP